MRRPMIVLLAGALACREPAPVGSSAGIVDSAGIQVVTSKAPALGERAAWKVAGSATLTLGGVAGDSALDFVGIVGARRFADGSLVVANGGTGELRWFSAAGKHLRTVGGRGRAPRFAAVSSLYSLGDTLLVWDGRARILTHLTASGDVLRTDTLRLADSTRMFAILGAFSDGGVLAEAGVALDLKDREPGFVRPDRNLTRFGSGGVADSIGVLPGEELYYGSRDGRASLSAVPFGLGSRLTVLPDGYVTTEGDRLQLEERDTAGRLRRIIRWPGARLPVSPDDIDRQGRALLGSAGTGMQRAQLDSVWRALPKPDSLPAIIGLVPDPASHVWVRRGGHVGDAEADWWVFAKDGAWLGTVALPTAASPLDISAEWIVLRTVDEDRIERVEVRRVRR